ncbi:MAG TPA: hypothetical protein VNA24_17095 [Hyalangium sp.]|jgi:hypothetical protein|nr:hypothetical protein [Hyalangium sp.]
MQPAEQQQKKRSPWLYVGIGCGCLLLLGVGAFVAGGVFLVKKGQQLQQDMANPITRTELVKKTLGAQTLPEGYYAVMSISVPALVDTAVLSNRAPGTPQSGQPGGEIVFVYLFIKPSTVQDREGLRRYLEGESEDASVLTRNNIHVGKNELIGRGVLALEGRRVLYLAQRGELQTRHSESESKGPLLNSILFIECPGQDRLRMALWMAPDPAPGKPLEQLELKGTPVDPETMRTFMSHINPCQES